MDVYWVQSQPVKMQSSWNGCWQWLHRNELLNATSSTLRKEELINVILSTEHPFKHPHTPLLAAPCFRFIWQCLQPVFNDPLCVLQLPSQSEHTLCFNLRFKCIWVKEEILELLIYKTESRNYKQIYLKILTRRVFLAYLLVSLE